MKRSKIIIAATAVLLGAGSFVFAHANGAKKKAAPSTAYFKVGSIWHTLFVGYSGVTILTTVNTSNQTARVKTHSGSAYTLHTQNTGTGGKALFY